MNYIYIYEPAIGMAMGIFHGILLGQHLWDLKIGNPIYLMVKNLTVPENHTQRIFADHVNPRFCKKPWFIFVIFGGVLLQES